MLRLLIVIALTFATSASAERPPNVVLIVIDDLGWMDLACQGNAAVDTPAIDRFAEQGMRFTSAYAAAPVCSPSRAALITGLAPARLRIINHLPDQERFHPDDPEFLPPPSIDHLPLVNVTIAERLKDAGYATAFIGKWHLSREDDTTFQPQHQGFDINIGGNSFGGPPSFFDPYRNPTIPDRKEGEYLPDRLADESIDFIRAHRDEPFLLCLWNYTVHWPMAAPEALLEKYADHDGPGLNDPRYGAMIEAMDASIGRVLDALDELQLTDDTLVIFTSDNGAYGGVGDNRPLRADKGHLYEGGVRVPLIVRWPGVSRGDLDCDVPVIGMDLSATILDAAGLDMADETLDGVSLRPLLTGSGDLDDRPIFIHYPAYAFHRSNRLGTSVRRGRYKLIEFVDGGVELYDLDEDLSETTNIADAHAELVVELRALIADWHEATNAPMPVRVR